MKLSKSKLALAKVINENGGWVDGAKWAAQDKFHCLKSNVVSFYMKGKPRHNGGDFWRGNDVHGEKIYANELVRNWHQACLSREEYYQAYPVSDADGWIDHNGKSNPVGGKDVVDVLFGNGRTSMSMCAGGWNWSWDGKSSASGFLIEKYRLHNPEVKPEFCESVTRSIPGSESIDELCAKVTEENKHQHVDAKPTIEQLAADYRNAKDYAERLQKEAGEASVKAESFAVEIRNKILELQELIGISKPESEPELVITDWRDLQVNDVIFVGEYEGYESGEYAVVWLEDSDYDGDYAVIVVGINGIERCVDTAMEWRFIRRP